MTQQLERSSAYDLINFMSHTNYNLTDHKGAPLASLDEAFNYVDSSEYDTRDGLRLIYPTYGAGQSHSVPVSKINQKWIVGSAIEGQGETIHQALNEFVGRHNLNSPYKPKPLVVESPKYVSFYVLCSLSELAEETFEPMFHANYPDALSVIWDFAKSRILHANLDLFIDEQLDPDEADWDFDSVKAHLEEVTNKEELIDWVFEVSADSETVSRYYITEIAVPGGQL